MIETGTALPRGLVLRAQIVSAAMPFGVAVFAAIVMLLPMKFASVSPPLSTALIAAAFVLLVGNTVLSTVLPRVVERARVRQLASSLRGAPPLAPERLVQALLQIKLASHVIAMALLEFPAILGLVTYLLSRNPIVLAIPAVAVALMLLRFPTPSRLRDWMTARAAALAELLQ